MPDSNSKNLKIAVSSRTFSKHPFLREELLKRYPNTVFNDEGKRFTSPELISFLKDADAAIVALEKVTDEVLQSLPKLKVIAKYGVGLDNLDLPALKKHGVQLGWKGGVNRRSVSELALFFALGQLRESFPQIAAMKNGEWVQLTGRNLSKKKFGIIGMGHIGQDLAKLLTPFECEIIFADILDQSAVCANPVYQGRVKQVSFEQVLKESDVISIHVPSNKKTRNLIDSRELSLMKKAAVLINTSRGGIVNEQALLTALQSGKIKACADVFTEEPTQNLELLKHPSFFSTPHIGGTTEESIRLMGLAAIESLDDYRDPLSYE